MIDANILLDWLLDRNQSHTLLIDRLFSSGKKFTVTDLTLAEIVFALERFYQLPRDIVSMNINKILEAEHLVCSVDLFSRTLVDYSVHPSLPFIDCYLLHASEMQKALPLLTFDKKLVNQGAGRAELVK